MLILAFETSAKAASVALLEEHNLLGESYQNCGQTHSRTLMKMAEDLLQNCGKTPDSVTAVAVASGPGSFTGVRIGVAAAKGFAWGLQLPCVGVSTLEAMAMQMSLFEGYVCCAMDARREQVYCALFRAKDGDLTRSTPDQAISLLELATQLRACDAPIIFVGDGAALCYNTLSPLLPACRLAPEQLVMQRASGVALAARRALAEGSAAEGATLTPNYLRLSQAERERAERERKEQSNG